jgi:hypothetical protein
MIDHIMIITNKLIKILITVLLASTTISASTFVMTPTQEPMGQGLFGFSIEHHFFGAIDDEPIDNFFGLDSGANTQFDLSYAIQDNLQVHVARTSTEKEFNLGTSYKLPEMKGIHPLVGLDFFSFKEVGQTSRDQNFFYHISGSYPNVIPKFVPQISIGIDGFDNHIGFGLGGEYQLLKSIYTTFEWVKTTDVAGNEHSFNMGISKKTFGHQFLLFATNNTNIGFRRAIEGASTKDWSLGFKITRVIEWL